LILKGFINEITVNTIFIAEILLIITK